MQEFVSPETIWPGPRGGYLTVNDINIISLEELCQVSNNSLRKVLIYAVFLWSPTTSISLS